MVCTNRQDFKIKPYRVNLEFIWKDMWKSALISSYLRTYLALFTYTKLKSITEIINIILKHRSILFFILFKWNLEVSLKFVFKRMAGYQLNLIFFSVGSRFHFNTVMTGSSLLSPSELNSKLRANLNQKVTAAFCLSFLAVLAASVQLVFQQV